MVVPLRDSFNLWLIMLNILKDHKMTEIYMFYSYRNHFSGFREVLRKQEVYSGTFPIPLKTN